MSAIREILDRFKQAKGFTTDIELANYLEVSKSTISNWIKRNSIDYALLFSKIEDTNYNWLIAGDKNKSYRIPEEETVKTEDINESLPDYSSDIPLYVQDDFSFKKKNTKICSLHIPNVKTANGAIYITAEKNYSGINKGDIVVYEEVKQILSDNSKYVLETRGKFHISEVRGINNNSVELLNGTSKVELKSTDIIGFARIVATINYQ